MVSREDGSQSAPTLSTVGLFFFVTLAGSVSDAASVSDEVLDEESEEESDEEETVKSHHDLFKEHLGHVKGID